MNSVKRHPFRFGCVVPLLLFVLLVIASAEASERADVALGWAIIGGGILGIGWLLTRLWRLASPQREIAQQQPIVPAPLPDLPPSQPRTALLTVDEESAPPADAPGQPARFGPRLALSLAVHLILALTIGVAIGCFLFYMASYYQSNGEAGERTAPPNDAATSAYMWAFWAGATLWIVAIPVIAGVVWWTRQRDRLWALVVPLAWAALWFLIAFGLTFYDYNIAHWD